MSKIDYVIKDRVQKVLEGLKIGSQITLVFVKPNSTTAENEVRTMVRTGGGLFGKIGKPTSEALTWTVEEVAGMIALVSESSTQVVAIYNGEVIE